MVDLNSNDSQLKDPKTIEGSSAKQRGLSLEEAEALAVRLKKMTKRCMQLHNKRRD